MKNPDPTYRTLCRLLSGQACPFDKLRTSPEIRRRDDSALTSTLGPDGWRLLATTARREGVAPLLYHALNESELPVDVSPDVLTDLRQTYYATTARNLLVYRELSRILTALHPIPIVALKGAALAATLYPSIGLRPMGDLDLLVPEERLTEAVARLKALGYIESHPDIAAGFNALLGHHVHLQGGQDVRLAVELHWTLIGGQHDWRSPSLPWFWQQTEPLPNSQFPTSNLHSPSLRLGSGQTSIFQLTPTAHLLYLCAHLMLQHGEAHSVLRWFYDIHLLVTREEQRIDWEELVVRAREFHWGPAVQAALAGTAARFTTPLPAGLLESLIESADPRDQALVQRKARPQTRGERVSDVLATLGWRARLHLVLANVVPSPAYMRWRYKPRPSWLWPLCYPYRWFDTLREGLTTLWKMANSRWRMANG